VSDSPTASQAPATSVPESAVVSVEAVSGGSPVTSSVKRWRVGTLTYTSGGLVVLFFWLLSGDFAWSIRERSISPVVQLLLNKFGASDFFNGLLLGSLPAAIAILVGPVICYRSDRHRGRWGRRIPFLLAPTPFAVLAIVGFAFSPAMGVSLDRALGPLSPGLNACVLALFAVFWTVFELAAITANSVFGALINDVVPEPVLGRFYSAFRAITLIAGILFGWKIFGRAETAYSWVFLFVAVVYGLGFTIMCLNVKEGGYPPPPDSLVEPPGFWNAVGAYFRESFGQPYYLWFFAAMSVAAMAFQPVNLFGLFYAKHVGMDAGAFGKCLAVTYACSLVLAYPIGVLADRFHPLRLGLASLALYTLVALWGAIFASNQWHFTIAFVVHGVLAGAFFTSTASIGQRLLPKARFAQFASALGIVICIGSLIIGPLSGALLDHVHHDYRFTFLLGGVFAIAAFLLLLVVYREFLALGGPRHYVAPE